MVFWKEFSWIYCIEHMDVLMKCIIFIVQILLEIKFMKLSSINHLDNCLGHNQSQFPYIPHLLFQIEILLLENQHLYIWLYIRQFQEREFAPVSKYLTIFHLLLENNKKKLNCLYTKMENNVKLLQKLWSLYDMREKLLNVCDFSMLSLLNKATLK